MVRMPIDGEKCSGYSISIGAGKIPAPQQSAWRGDAFRFFSESECQMSA